MARRVYMVDQEWDDQMIEDAVAVLRETYVKYFAKVEEKDSSQAMDVDVSDHTNVPLHSARSLTVWIQDDDDVEGGAVAARARAIKAKKIEERDPIDEFITGNADLCGPKATNTPLTWWIKQRKDHPLREVGI